MTLFRNHGFMMESDGTALTELRFADSRSYAHIGVLGFTDSPRNDSVIEQTCRWLDIYFSGREPDFLPPLSPQGTPFQ